MAETDDDLDREALLRQLSGGNTGVLGNQAEVAATRGQDAPALDPGGPTPPVTPAPPVNYGGEVGQYGSALEGFDAGKLGSDHDSAKYQIGRTLSHFDPRQGVTPEALAALNGLGIGTFAGSGDRLRVTGGSHGLQGDTDLDVVRGFKDPNSGGGWQYGLEADDLTRKGGGGGQGGGRDTGPSSLSTIQGLMPTDSGFTQSLQDQLAQALGGYPALDRAALLKLMGGTDANAR